MKIKNKRMLKRIMEVSLATGLIVTTLSGCTNDLQTEIVEEADTEDPSFISYEDIVDYKYYIICIDDISYDEKVYITRIPNYVSINHLGNRKYEYFYKDASPNAEPNKIMGSVFYDRDSKKISNRTGPEILYAIRLVDYLDYYDVKKEGYNKIEYIAIYNQAKKDYENNNFEELQKEKVLIKENKS